MSSKLPPAPRRPRSARRFFMYLMGAAGPPKARPNLISTLLFEDTAARQAQNTARAAEEAALKAE